MKEVEKTNTAVIYLQQEWAEFVPKHDPYVIDMNRKRNCYSYEGFEYVVRNYRN